MTTYRSIAFTDAVRQTQRRLGSPLTRHESEPDPSALGLIGPDERAFIEARDGFYQATVSETGWPYLQYRGGPAGFVRCLDDRTLGYADLRGNRQYISVGNLASDDRVALFFMDYANQARLKAFGRARLVEDPHDEHLQHLARFADRGLVERAVLIDIEASDWNCRQHITERWTRSEMDQAVQPLLDRIADLETQLSTGRASN